MSAAGSTPPPPRRAARCLASALLRTGLRCALGCAVLAAPALARSQDGPAPASGRFIALSDIHLDPTATGMGPALAGADPAAWAAILDRAPAAPARYGQDTPWPLLRGALDAMRGAEPHPAFLILTGDLLAHRFHRRFAASGVRGRGPAAYRTFVGKTIAFVAGEVARRFPDAPVFLALGNDDSDCGDYGLVPRGAFLRATLPLARALLHLPSGTSFDREWVGGLGYALPNPALPGVRMVFLDSVLLSARYRQGCSPPHRSDPGQAALDWLERRLDESRRAGERVWLLLHVPPGADAFSTAHAGGGCPGAPVVPLWKPAHARRFLALAARYAPTIAAAFAGHTHMDEFRLLGAGGRASGVVLGTPAISPIFGQNPGFHLYAYGPSGALQDRETWYLPDLAPARPAAPPAWRREYDVGQLWNLPALDLPSLAALARRLLGDARARATWFATYRVGRPLPLPRTPRAYTCAVAHADLDEYRRCLCGAGTPPFARPPGSGMMRP